MQGVEHFLGGSNSFITILQTRVLVGIRHLMLSNAAGSWFLLLLSTFGITCHLLLSETISIKFPVVPWSSVSYVFVSNILPEVQQMSICCISITGTQHQGIMGLESGQFEQSEQGVKKQNAPLAFYTDWEQFSTCESELII